MTLRKHYNKKRVSKIKKALSKKFHSDLWFWYYSKSKIFSNSKRFSKFYF
jgi:hypothetical protein